LNASESNKKPNTAENCGSIFLAAAPLSFPISGAELRQLSNIHRNPPRLIFYEQLGR
jgi:hypothetical protein